MLAAEKAEGPKRVQRGLVATGRGIPRPHMSVSLTPDVMLGEITSGSLHVAPAAESGEARRFSFSDGVRLVYDPPDPG